MSDKIKKLITRFFFTIRSHLMKTLILGLGNPILTDDGVGVLVAQEIQKQLPDGCPIDVTEVSVGGLTLMESMIGYDRVILVDAIQTENGIPGKIYKLNIEELQTISPTQHSSSPHDASLITALEAGRSMGITLPEEIEIYAVEVENVIDFSENPTPAVLKSIPILTNMIMEEIHKDFQSVK
jgi:hydrogenase maturation protease